MINDTVKKWANLVGAPAYDSPVFPTEDRVTLALSLIKEEFLELVAATKAKDMEAVADAHGDLLWVVIRSCQEFGLDPDKLINAIAVSNNTKFAYSKEEAEEVIEDYKAQEIEAEYEQVGNIFVIRNKETKKVLKNKKRFKKPNFADLMLGQTWFAEEASKEAAPTSEAVDPSNPEAPVGEQGEPK